MLKNHLFFVCFFISLLPVTAQRTLKDWMTNPSLNAKNVRNLQWFAQSNDYTYTSDDGTQLLKGNLTDSLKTVLLDAAQLPGSPKRFPFIKWFDSNQFDYTNAAGEMLRYNINSNAQTLLFKSPSELNENIDLHAESKNVAFTQEQNLLVMSNGKEINVSNESNPSIVYGAAAHRSEFGITKGTFWSPSGSKLAFYRMDQTMVTDYPLVNITTIPAQVKNIKYPMAGQKSHEVTLGIFDVKAEKVIYLKTTGDPEQYLTNITWSPDEMWIYVAIVNRDQNEMKLCRYSSNTGELDKLLFEEKAETWVEPQHGITFLPNKPDQFIWQSEKDGFNHIYLYQTDGKLIKQISKGEFVVTEILGFDTKAKEIFVQVATNKGLDRAVMKINLSSLKSKNITLSSGTHQALLSKDGQFLIDIFSSPNSPKDITIINADGKPIKTLLNADNPLKSDKPNVELVQLTSSDGQTLNARLIKPTNFDASKKYPVIVYVYGGPHAQMVTNRWLLGAQNWMLYAAEHGYVVFTLDNRGSEFRGKQFEHGTHRKLGELETADQLLGVNFLKSQSYIDGNKIGVHGWSYGGFMTTTLVCDYPDLFKAGVAGGPVIDWRYYEIMYTERYMDHPNQNQSGYDNNSLLKKATKLNSRLMLIHGTIDDVVVWQHSQRFVQECVTNEKLIDYMIYPEHPHNVSGKDRIHLMQTVMRYFDEHLK